MADSKHTSGLTEGLTSKPALRCFTQLHLLHTAGLTSNILPSSQPHKHNSGSGVKLGQINRNLNTGLTTAFRLLRPDSWFSVSRWARRCLLLRRGPQDLCSSATVTTELLVFDHTLPQCAQTVQLLVLPLHNVGGHPAPGNLQSSRNVSEVLSRSVPPYDPASGQTLERSPAQRQSSSKAHTEDQFQPAANVLPQKHVWTKGGGQRT